MLGSSLLRVFFFLLLLSHPKCVLQPKNPKIESINCNKEWLNRYGGTLFLRLVWEEPQPTFVFQPSFIKILLTDHVVLLLWTP